MEVSFHIQQLSATTHLLLRYHSHKGVKGLNGHAHQYKYHCAQVSSRQHKPRKVEDEKKHRDRESMATFDCNGWLKITMEEIDTITVAKIEISHADNHIPYLPIDVPQDVLDMIKDGKDKPIKDVRLYSCIVGILSLTTYIQIGLERYSRQTSRAGVRSSDCIPDLAVPQ